MIEKADTNPFHSPQIYWCHVCDNRRVNSTKPETGKFYQVFGHEYSTGDYTSVFFAVCNKCKMEQAIKPI